MRWWCLLVTLCLVVWCPRGLGGAAVSAPDDSEATVLPPSLVYNERPPLAVQPETSGGPASEVVATHHSTCLITTEQLVASSRAAVTRVLKGICNAREMDDRLHNLEVQMGDQMTVLKTMLLSIEERLGDVDNNVKRSLRAEKGSCHCDPAPPPEDVMNDHAPWIRDSEIQLYNSSIYFVSTPPDLVNISSRSEQRVFTYFWRVRDMMNKLTRWETRRSLRSPSFYTSPSGYKMYIRLYPRQNGKNVYLHVGLTRGEHDTQLEWPFKLKHRITVLDQREEHAQDIHSRVWDPTQLCSGYNWKRPTVGDNYECVGLGFPQDVLKSRDYIFNNSMIVKLTVYLDI